MYAWGFLFPVMILLAAGAPSVAGESPRILGELSVSSTADSLHIDYDVFVNDQVDSLVLEFREPVRIFDARDPQACSFPDTLRIHSLFIRAEAGLYTQHLVGRRSWPQDGRSDRSRIWLEYWGREDTDAERQSKRKFWELKEFSLGFSFQPLVIIGSSYNYHDPEVAGLEKQFSHLESLFLGLHANYGRWRLTLGEGGSAGNFYGEADSTQQTYEFMTGTSPYLRYDLGDLRGFRLLVGAGWHLFDLQMQGPRTQEQPPAIDRKEEGLGLTVGVADPAGTLTYTFLDLDHYRHGISLSVPVMTFRRTALGTRLDYVQVDGRPVWKTHFVVDFSTPLHPKDGPLMTPEAVNWTWRNYAALAVAGVAEPVIVAGAVVYLAVKGVGALF